MTLEQAIHQQWAASAELSGLMPAERLTTGRTAGGELPSVVLARRAVRIGPRTHRGAILETVQLDLEIWHQRQSLAQAVAEVACRVLDGSHFELPGGARVMHLRCERETVEQQAAGRWRWTLHFVASIQRER